MPRADHAAEFETATVHFVMTATVAKQFDVSRAARRLLVAGVAVSAAWSDESVIRVDPRLRRGARQLRRARLLHARVERLRSDLTWSAAFALLLSRPKLGLLALWWAWRSHVVAPRLKRFIDGPSLLKLAWFVLRHPIVGIRDVLPAVRRNSSPASSDAEGRQTTANPGSLVEGDSDSRAVPHSPPDESALPEDADDFGTRELLEILNEAEENYIQSQIVSAAERVIDDELFGHSGLARPFVRLTLRNSYHDFEIGA